MDLNTGEMYLYAAKNPNAKFVRLETGRTYSFNLQGQLVFDDHQEVRVNPKVDEKWRVVPVLVTWQEAIKAWLEDGREVIVELDGHESIVSSNLGFFLDKKGMAISNAEFVKGNWSIR